MYIKQLLIIWKIRSTHLISSFNIATKLYTTAFLSCNQNNNIRDIVFHEHEFHYVQQNYTSIPTTIRNESNSQDSNVQNIE